LTYLFFLAFLVLTFFFLTLFFLALLFISTLRNHISTMENGIVGMT
jgi:hypothetical protein